MNYFNYIGKRISDLANRFVLSSPNASLPLRGKRILVIDDSADARDYLSLVLKNGGANIETASDGNEGLIKIESYKPDILLLDLEMPELDGFGVIRQLRAQNYSKPVLAITVHDSIHDKDRCQDAGFDGYISKPFNQDRLLQVLKVHLAHG